MKIVYTTGNRQNRNAKKKELANIHKMISQRNKWTNDTRKRLLASSSKWEKNIINFLQSKGIKAYLQYPVMYNNTKYFIDVYIPSAKCGIEVDGNYHLTPWQIENDKKRTMIINRLGIRIERIYNEETTYQWALDDLYKKIMG